MAVQAFRPWWENDKPKKDGFSSMPIIVRAAIVFDLFIVFNLLDLVLGTLCGILSSPGSTREITYFDFFLKIFKILWIEDWRLKIPWGLQVESSIRQASDRMACYASDSWVAARWCVGSKIEDSLGTLGLNFQSHKGIIKGFMVNSDRNSFVFWQDSWTRQAQHGRSQIQTCWLALILKILYILKVH